MFYLKYIILTYALFSLAGCQSNIQKFGVKHKTTISKWSELAKFAESDLTSHNIKLVASFSLNGTESTLYNMNDFRISSSEHFNDINLLAPTIKQKFICNPRCKQLSRLITKDNIAIGVLSDFYFDQSEFELFKFYGDLYLLNENITDFKNHAPDLVNSYFVYLASQEQKFSNLDDFMAHLKQSLSQEAFYNFVNDPTKRFKSLSYSEHKESYWGPPTLNNLSKNWSRLALENGQWLNKDVKNAEAVILQNIQDQNIETFSWKNEEDQNSKSLFTDEIQLEDGDVVKLITESDLAIGDIICHGPSNTFGLIQHIIGKNVTVQLAGKLIIFSEGIRVEPKPNDILSQEGNIDFVSINESQDYLVDDIHKCRI